MPTPPLRDIESVATDLASRYPNLPAPALHRYLCEIVTWNDRAGLVSKRSTLPVLARLVDQSARLWALIAEHKAVTAFVDVGTGGGFPGIIWKLMVPDARALLVERREKKAAFLGRTVAVLGLDRVDVFCGDARDAGHVESYSQAFDAAATLAVALPEKTIPLIEPFLRKDGVFATLAARDHSPVNAAGMRLIASAADTGGTLCIYQ